MKVGRGPRRAGGPSAEFTRRREERERAERDAAARAVPAEGDVRVFLDDERPCPAGWTLATTAAEAIALLTDPAVAPRIVEASLDWHLGDRGEPKGSVASDAIAAAFEADPGFLPALETMSFHSTNRDESMAMLRRVRGALPRERRYDVLFGLTAPR